MPNDIDRLDTRLTALETATLKNLSDRINGLAGQWGSQQQLIKELTGRVHDLEHPKDDASPAPECYQFGSTAPAAYVAPCDVPGWPYGTRVNTPAGKGVVVPDPTGVDPEFVAVEMLRESMYLGHWRPELLTTLARAGRAAR